MKVLFDTNVIIDGLTCRDYDYEDARDLILKASAGLIEGYISAKQVTDIYYILRKHIANNNDRLEAIKTIISTFEVLPTLASDLSACIKTNFNDFEDAVIDMSAKVNMINVIVTKNVKHFEQSKAYIYTPEQLNQLVRNPNIDY